MVGISVFEQGAVVAERYRVVERLTRFSAAGQPVVGVDYEYWLAIDETRETEVWLQVAASRGTVAGGGQLAAAAAALRRLNHPAIPIILDFGEVEIGVVEEAEAAEFEDVVVTGYGYVVLAPIEGETFAAALARATLTEVEILAILIELAEVITLIHEVELVHGHLSAYSVLLVEEDLVLIDLAASLGIEAAAGGELTAAADVYALAWLACIALVGLDVIEAEFGIGNDVGFSPEDTFAPASLTLELVERRRVWAELNLIAVYGVGAALAAVIVAGLGENAAARPSISQFGSALRVREVTASAGEAVVLAAGAAALLEAVEVAEAVEAASVVETLAAAEAVAEVTEAQQAQTAQAALAAAAVGAGVGVGATETAAVFAAQAENAPTTTLPRIAPAPTSARPRPRPAATRPPATSHRTASAPPTKKPTGAGAGLGGWRRRKSAAYIGIIVAVLIIGGTAWALSKNGSSSTTAPVASVATSTPGTTATEASTPQNTVTATPAPSAAPSTAITVGAVAAQSTPTVASTPNFVPSPLATVPASPGQALQQIQQVVTQGKAAGQIPAGTLASLGQTISTLQQEIGGGSSTAPGTGQLRQILAGNTVPESVSSQLSQLIPYLSPISGS
jgi:hypothetical protein